MRTSHVTIPHAARAAATVIALTVCLALTACSAKGKPGAIETKLANAAKDVVIPFEAEHLTNPTPATDLTVAQGREIFQQRCALCHSNDGKSQNQLGLAMYPPAMDLTSPHVQAWKDAELYWIIQNGIRLTGMPAWQDILSDQDTWKLTRFIHALPRLTPQKMADLNKLVAPPAPVMPAAEAPAANRAKLLAYGNRVLHQEGCLSCHRFQGEGEDVGPDLSREGARGRTDAWLTGHFKNPSAYTKDSMMPAFDQLSPEQLRGLVALLQNAKGTPPPSSNPK